MDPDASELSLPPGPVKAGQLAECSVAIRDQDRKMVFVEGMKVEVKAMWMGRGEQGEGEGPKRQGRMLDRITGLRRPTFSREYCSTRLNGHTVYHAISMMMVSHSSGCLATAYAARWSALQQYSDYCFEELRLFAPKIKK